MGQCDISGRPLYFASGAIGEGEEFSVDDLLDLIHEDLKNPSFILGGLDLLHPCCTVCTYSSTDQ